MDKIDDYMTISEITKKLNKLASQLEEGTLSTEEVVEMTEMSRDLYERLVVIRHKSFEEIVERERELEPEPIQEEKSAEKESEPEYTPTEETPEVVSEQEEMPQIPIGKAAVSPNQISLIDSIEEIQQSLNEKYTDDGKTLSDQLKKQPIRDLRTAIGINQKFRFVSTLFDENVDAFKEAVEKLNSCSSFIEADDYIKNSLKDRYDWQMKNPVVKELVDLVERRYL